MCCLFYLIREKKGKFFYFCYCFCIIYNRFNIVKLWDSQYRSSHYRSFSFIFLSFKIYYHLVRSSCHHLPIHCKQLYENLLYSLRGLLLYMYFLRIQLQNHLLIVEILCQPNAIALMQSLGTVQRHYYQ